jgi:hypothetical protein
LLLFVFVIVFFWTIDIKRGVFYWVFLAGLPFFPGPARELCSNNLISLSISSLIMQYQFIMSHIALTHCVSTTLAAASAVQLNSIFLAKMNPRENPGGEKRGN